MKAKFLGFGLCCIFALSMFVVAEPDSMTKSGSTTKPNSIVEKDNILPNSQIRYRRYRRYRVRHYRYRRYRVRHYRVRHYRYPRYRRYHRVRYYRRY